MSAAVASSFKAHRRQVWNSVFPEPSNPTPQATPTPRFPDQGQPFGGVVGGGSVGVSAAAAAGSESFPGALHGTRAQNRAAGSRRSPRSPAPPLGLGLGGVDLAGPDLRSAADDQITYDRAWHVVTSRVALPSTVTAEDSFGTLLPESQLLSSQEASSEAEFQAALRMVLNAKASLPRANHTEDILLWHSQQVRQHFAQHVVPMLSACTAQDTLGQGHKMRSLVFDHHMTAVMNSVRTLEAAFRQYDYGLALILRGYQDLESRRDQEDVDMEHTSEGIEVLASRFRKDVRSLVGNSVPEDLIASLRVVLTSLVSRILGISGAENDGDSAKPSASGPGRPGKSAASSRRPAAPRDDDLEPMAARKRLHELVGSLATVGLTGEQTHVLFAEVMDKLMSDFISGAFAGTWMSEDTPDEQEHRRRGYRTATGLAERNPTCTDILGHWVENHFARLALEALGLMADEEGEEEGPNQPSDGPCVSFADVTKWKEIAFGRLAALRISELFDIVLHWPKSRSGLDDLRSSVATPQRRLQLSESFSAALHARLLHSSRSTLEILRVYIAMIRTFHILDHSKVLLGRVVPSLQLYLCQREDAIRLVVTGLLANPDEINEKEEFGIGAGSGPYSKDTSIIVGAKATSLVELATLLNDPAQQRRKRFEDDDIDWNDMDWVPDPVDAGVNYKRPKSEDVIGTLISALGAEDVFINEFQNIIAERLLSSQEKFDQEIKVLQLLKKRFGESALQSCDVMIRDIKDSGRLDPYVRRTQFVAQFRTPRANDATAQEPAELRYTARILSRLFWPTMNKEHFLLPQPILDKQKHYEKGYEQIKSSRRLTWLNHLGQATVDLELQDRSVSVVCRTWEATVVYAFQEGEGDGGEVRKSVEELYMTLQMDEDLIIQALEFWVEQRVLKRVGDDVFAVMETLPASEEQQDDESGAGATATEGHLPRAEQTPAEAAAAAAMRRNRAGTTSVDAKVQQQQTVCWQFIVGMLTNSAASMPLAQISMMMKMMMAGGFPWSNEELQEFLAQKVTEGHMEVVGGKYKLVKK
ncbi:hypothetical protein PspLS_07400 [Pyricularia sp. CBS 133598]|nr:hypothetical protein PspLS_07400 [Pyricularia sp. CBS 133598]